MPKGKAKGRPVKKASASKMGRKSKPTKAGVKKAMGGEAKARKPIRFKAGTVALREIRRYQNSTKHLIPLAPFVRLVKNIAHEHSAELRFSR